MAPLPFLDWPADLFAAANAAAPRDTPMLIVNETYCACGCNQRHNRAVSTLEDRGGERRVLWFRTIACKNQYAGVADRRNSQ